MVSPDLETLMSSGEAPSELDSSRMPRIRRVDWLVIAITLIGAAIRIGNVAFVEQSFSLDESHTIYVNSLSIDKWWGFITSDAAHPPLFPAILKGWTWVAGDGRIALRIPSIAFGILAIPAIFSLGQELFGRRSAAVAASLAAISELLLFWSGVVRTYALLIWISVVSTIWFIRVLKSGGQGWRVYAICQILGLYTHYLFITICIGQALVYGLFVLTNTSTSRLLVRLLGAQAIAAIAYIPWLPIFYNVYSEQKAFGLYQQTAMTSPDSINYRPVVEKPAPQLKRWNSLTSAPFVFGRFLGMYRTKSPIARAALGVPFGVALLILSRAMWFGLAPRFAVASMVIIGVMPFAFNAVWKSHLHIPDRYALAGLPFILLMLSSVMVAARSSSYPRVLKGLTMLAIGAIAAQSIASIPRLFQLETRGDAHLAARYLEEQCSADDLIVYNAPWMQVRFDYYFKQDRVSTNQAGFHESVYSWWERAAFKGWGGPVTTQQDLKTFVENVERGRWRRIWLVTCPEEDVYYDEFGKLRQSLGQNWRIVQEREFKFGKIIEFVRP